MLQYPDPDTPCGINWYCQLSAGNMMDIPLSLSCVMPDYILKTYRKIYRKGILPFSMHGLRAAATTLYPGYIQIGSMLEKAIAAEAGGDILYPGSHAMVNVVSIPMAKRYSIGNQNRNGVTIPTGHLHA
jgi:hypothetical protein